MPLWSAAARLVGLIVTGKRVIKVSRAVLGSIRQERGPEPDEGLKDRLAAMEFRVERIEAEVEELKRSVRRLSSALYALGALAAIALLLALIKLA
ncbi:MAG TPA: hypothetical protein DDW94_06510 [Deltaproteobacteria bacterium]|nr:MAG: hypothetical protein A2Z79_01040 [Deltaproteobacteria bacterium GWA2_55_82]OGQ62118.1 MAG: hypothetical protein A3I81_04165 [Deltaproteobacteria bacterium RIFCSPLOWO2_02_FULL_55_12]OIJ74023.1 MAG: hypothetical protein A2V21_306950 [Deltaproteobacteria bacterium GWC2_55_46]HBG46629.1 hypothetical protein [Deltaproteobacteria bacterium]HCY11363.1 hypothetical protein [Deltaproteobacteria bacterium]